MYESFRENTERLMTEVDRLSDDTKKSQQQAKDTVNRLREVNELAKDLADAAQDLRHSIHDAGKIATSAGEKAGQALSASTNEAAAVLIKKINTVINEADIATNNFRRSSTQVKGWAILCVISAILSGLLSAYGTYSLIKRDPATSREIQLMSYGSKLETIYSLANAKERKVIDDLLKRKQ